MDSHGSQSIDGHGTLAALSSLCGAAVLVALWIAFARGAADRDRFVRYAAACVCAFVAFGKVLSPQYLIWLVPLVALVSGRRGIAAVALLVAALVATQAWFPVPLLELRRTTSIAPGSCSCATCCSSRWSRLLALPSQPGAAVSRRGGRRTPARSAP